MATRFRLQSQALAPVVVALSASWTKTPSGVLRRAMSARGSTRTTSTNVGLTFTATLTTEDCAHVQWVSEPIAAQTISGTVKGQCRAFEANAANDARSQMTAYVVSRDGQTVRGTLLAFDTSALSNEWATSSTNRKFPKGWAGAGTAISSVAAQDGDRIVIELGARSTCVVSSSYTNTLTIGEQTAGDLPEDETDTTAAAAWFEFSHNVVFLAEAAASDATAPDPAFNMRGTQMARGGNVRASVGFPARAGDASGVAGSGPPVPPTLGTVTPTPGAINAIETVGVQVLSTEGAALVVITAEFPTLGRHEVIFDGTDFVDRYAAESSTSGTSLNQSFSIKRTTGWIDVDTIIRVVAVSLSGGVLNTELVYDVSSIRFPAVDNATEPSTILRTSPVSFDLESDVPGLLAVIAVRYEDLGRTELVAVDGVFEPEYAGLSTRSTISGGWHYSIMRGTFWPSNPQIRAYFVNRDSLIL